MNAFRRYGPLWWWWFKNRDTCVYALLPTLVAGVLGICYGILIGNMINALLSRCIR